MAETDQDNRALVDRVVIACPYGELTRQQAEECVAGHTFLVSQYSAVSYYSCRQLLGDRFDLLLKDPIRNKGPSSETIYPWNVVDYMVPEYPRPKQR